MLRKKKRTTKYINPKFHLPKMSTSEVIPYYPSMSNQESYRSIYGSMRPWDVELKLVTPLLNLTLWIAWLETWNF